MFRNKNLLPLLGLIKYKEITFLFLIGFNLIEKN